MTDQLSFKTKYRNWADSFNGLPMSSGLALNYRVTAETSKGGTNLKPTVVNSFSGSADSIGSSEKLATRLALKKDSLKGWVLLQQRVSADASAGSSNSLAPETQPADLNSLRRGWMYRQSGQSRTLVTRLKESDIAATHQVKEGSRDSSSNQESDKTAGLSDYANLHLLTEVSDIGATRTRGSGRTLGRSIAANKQKQNAYQMKYVPTRKLAEVSAGWQSPFYTGRCQYAIAPTAVQNSNSVTGDKVSNALVKPQNTLSVGLSLIHPAESIINSIQQGYPHTTAQKASKVTSDSDEPQLIRGRCLRTMRGKMLRKVAPLLTLRAARKSRSMVARNSQKSVAYSKGHAGSLISLCGSLGYLPERESLAYAKAGIGQKSSATANGKASVSKTMRKNAVVVATPNATDKRSEHRASNLTLSQRQSRSALYYGGITKADSSKKVKQINSFDVRLASLGKVQVATREQSVTDNSHSVRLSRNPGLLHSFPYNLAVKQKYAVSNASAGTFSGSQGRGPNKWQKAGGKQSALATPQTTRSSVNSNQSSARVVILSEKAVYASCVRVTTALLKQLSAKTAA